MKIISRVFKTIRILIIGWGIAAPLSYLVPLKKNLVLFVGKNGGLFFDNVKYLYLYLHRLKQNGIEHYFFTEDKSVYRAMQDRKLPVVFYPSMRSIFTLVRAKVIVSCSTRWIKNYRHHLSLRAKKVELWHGIPLKKIGLLKSDAVERQNSFFGRMSDAIRAKHHYYDLFVSTSEYFTREVFSKTMRSRNFIESGYPRNDIFFKETSDELDLLGADVDSLSRISEQRDNGFRAVLYAPTLGDPLGNAIKAGFLNLDKLSLFARKNKLLFVFKFHPSVSRDEQLSIFDNIIFYDSLKDIQPLLKITDVLVTDYSSVFIDFLLLDRPIIFFAYNREKFIKTQGGLLFDYDLMTPGPICSSQDQLQEAIINCTVRGIDNYTGKRNEIKKLAFKYEDGRASERIWSFICDKYLRCS